MFRYISRLQILEEGLNKELSDLDSGIRGLLRVGFGMTRGEILVPKFTKEFLENTTNIDLQVILADTKDLESLLLSGELDLFLGVSTERNVMFMRKHIQTENLYLIIPEVMLKKYFPSPESYEASLKIFSHGIDLKVMPDLPFILSHEGSRTTLGVRQYYKQKT